MSTEPPRAARRLAELDYSILQQCIHCGMCLPSCPTYAETGRERNSPRGRIALMRAVADEELTVTPAFAEEMSYCLGCLACTSACPAGVDYGHLLEVARSEVEERGVLETPWRRAVRRITLRGLFLHPRLLRLAGRALWLWQVTGMQRLFRKLHLTRLLPAPLRNAEPLAPEIRSKFSDSLIPAVSPARSPRRYRVALLTGCMQDLIFSDVNAATAEVLTENGCEVITPREQACCGSLHAHNGDLESAEQLARRQLDAIDPSTVDAIISNAGGCGFHLRHYDRLLAGDPAYAARAREWSAKLRDIHEWLAEIGFRAPKNPDAPVVPVTYHESCHLCHGLKVSQQPRAILRAIPGVELVECKDATTCCGSAGIYNLTQPETAKRLQENKVAHLRTTGAAVVATANPGCHLHIAKGFGESTGRQPRIVHPIVLLNEAYQRERIQEPSQPSAK
jgi:glycolate oxidase iron-sulfur subunit